MSDVDPLVAPWVAAVPQIDPRVEGVVERVHLVGRYLDRLRNRVAQPHDITARDYDVLARLFWTGAPHRLTPTQLAAGTHAPATTVTSRLDRLERRGLLRRVPDPADRRSLLAELTEAGGSLFTRVVIDQAREERALLGDLTNDDLERLRELLQLLMDACEKNLGPPTTRVGTTAAAAPGGPAASPGSSPGSRRR